MINGLITKKDIESGTAKISGKPFKRWVFTIDDRKYSTFDEKIGNQFDVGHFVEIDGYQKGQYFNMTAMRIFEEKQKKSGDEVVELLRQILSELKRL